jgi:hypothetical protein
VHSATHTLITTLVHAEDTRFVALYVTKLKLVIREDIGQTVPTSNPIDTTIPKSRTRALALL